MYGDYHFMVASAKDRFAADSGRKLAKFFDNAGGKVAAGGRGGAGGRDAMGREPGIELADQGGLPAGGAAAYCGGVGVQCDSGYRLDTKCQSDMVIQAVGSGGDYDRGGNLCAIGGMAAIDYTCGNYVHSGDDGFDSGKGERC